MKDFYIVDREGRNHWNPMLGELGTKEQEVCFAPWMFLTLIEHIFASQFVTNLKHF